MPLKDRFITLANALLPDGWQVGFRESAGTTIDPDEENWRRLTGDIKRDLLPITQWRMQRIAHYLWEQNLLANRLIELPVAFLLAEGVKLTCKDPENQKLLDRFWTDPINDMDLKLPKKVRELSIFGEQCYPAFVNEHDGMVRIGYLDPALIETVVKDPDNPEQTIGIVTTRDRKGNARRYRVIVNGPEDVFTSRTRGIRETFTDGDAFYFPINDLSSGTRGRSDLLAQADWLDGYDEYLWGEMDRQRNMRAFIWDVTLKNADEAAVKKRAREITTPAPASVRVHNDSELWSAEAPDLKSVDVADGARLLRNHILGGATIPEPWFGGGGDVNRATAAEMDLPTLKTLSMRQRILKHMLESMGRYVLLKAHGDTIDFAEPKNKVTAVFPELASADTSKYAAAFQQVVAGCMLALDRNMITHKTALGILSTVAGQLGLEIDVEAELTAAQAEAEKNAQRDTYTVPGANTPAAKAE